jgi:hypothetical protein
MANRGRRGTSPLPIIRVAYVVLKRLDPNLNHAAMLANYYTAIKDDRVPRSLCGLDQAQSIECTSSARCKKCWELLPTNAARVAALDNWCASGRNEVVADAPINQRSGGSIGVYAVHTILPGEVTPVELVCSTPEEATQYAKVRSTDSDVLGAAVTRHTLDTPGERRGVALYVDGRRQQTPYVSDDRRIPACGARR